MSKILITGATGFIGKALVNSLLDTPNEIIVAVRKTSPCVPNQVKQFVTGDVTTSTDWSLVLQGIDKIIHCAARAHIMRDLVADPLAEFRKINTDATLTLAEQAAAAGVKRFIFISSIKVNGEKTSNNQAFLETNTFIPTDPYALSKYEAEQGLFALAKKTKMQIVIIRPPLVYGPGVKANFLSLLHWVDSGIPLPLGRTNNLRSLLALENLTHFIHLCLEHPNAANQIFLISDNEDVSTTELLRKVAHAFNKPARLIPVPYALLSFFAKFTHKKDTITRLFDSLLVDNSKAQDTLGWRPSISIDEQLQKTVSAYLLAHKR